VIRILDVCCGAGGASAGYAQAGFDVVGVDIAPQPQYPYEFHQGDAVEFIKAHGHEFDAIHASFPCQRYTKGAGRWGTRESHPDLIGPGRDAILATRLPYVIENVEEARTALISPIRLCGQMFTLGVFRHRLFEMPWFTGAHPPHRTHNGRIGDGKYVTVTGAMPISSVQQAHDALLAMRPADASHDNCSMCGPGMVAEQEVAQVAETVTQPRPRATCTARPSISLS
jgi:hypothetical protein